MLNTPVVVIPACSLFSDTHCTPIHEFHSRRIKQKKKEKNIPKKLGRDIERRTGWKLDENRANRFSEQSSWHGKCVWRWEICQLIDARNCIHKRFTRYNIIILIILDLLFILRYHIHIRRYGSPRFLFSQTEWIKAQRINFLEERKNFERKIVLFKTWFKRKK